MTRTDWLAIAACTAGFVLIINTSPLPRHLRSFSSRSWSPSHTPPTAITPRIARMPICASNVGKECLGLLAYASTFQEVSKKELDPDAVERLPFFNDLGLERSLSSMQAVNQLTNERAIRRNSVLQNIILWVVGFVISVIGLLQVTETKIEEPSHMLRLFGRFAVQSTEYLAGLVAFAICVTVMLHSDARFDPRKWRATIGLVRIVSAWPRWLSGGVFLLLGSLVILLLYWLLRIF